MTATDSDTPFSQSYAEARARFCAACGAAGVETQPYAHPSEGPEGEALALDAAWFGPRDADRVLVTISATHGVEGFCGSALQTDWIERSAAVLPAGMAALHLHALNPHGFAWLRRVNEDGIDLNRNFIDFSQPLPSNPGYEELRAALFPECLDNAAMAAADGAIAAYQAERGQRATEIAISGGQYVHAEGLFYGGTGPSWSRRTIETIFGDFALTERSLVAAVDIHTGLGPFGYGEVICDHPPGSPEALRGRSWYGSAMTEPALGTSTSVPKTGLLDYAWQGALGEAVTFVTLEFGTYPVEAMFHQLRADHLLHRTGPIDWAAPGTQAVKQALRQHFFPDTGDWRNAVLTRGREVLAQATMGIAAA